MADIAVSSSARDRVMAFPIDFFPRLRFISIFVLLLAAAVTLFSATPASAADSASRSSLPIVRYGVGLGSLSGPAQDASLMAAALRKAGFQVTVVQNADLATMQQAVIAHAERLREAGDGAVSFVHYSGHGAATDR